MENEEPKTRKRIQLKDTSARRRKGGAFTIFMLIISTLSVGTIYFVLRELRHVDIKKTIDPRIVRIKAANLQALAAYVKQPLQEQDIAADSILDNNDFLYLSKILLRRDASTAFLIVIKMQQDALANISYDTATAVLKCKPLVKKEEIELIKDRNHWPVLIELN